MNDAVSRIRVPHTLVLLFAMIVLAQLLTYALPKGQYERFTNDHHREQVVADSYAQISDAPALPWHTVLTSIPRGFEAAQDIIFFVFIIGGALGVMRATGAIDAFLGFLLTRFAGRPSLLIGGTMLVFGIGSSTIGMAEEYIPFLPMLVALSVGLGYDRLVGVAVLCVGYGIGYGAAAFNPFTVVIAQGLAGVDPTSGWLFRVVLFVIFAAIGLHHIFRYANRVKADASASLVTPEEADYSTVSTQRPKFTGTHGIILSLMGAAIVVLVVGIARSGWYLTEIGAIFLALSILFVFVARLSADEGAKAFCVGAAELTTTALLIGFARSISLVLSDGLVVDTIIYGAAGALSQMGAAGAAVGMGALQCAANFFIPSGSGQAYVTMPLMAPLADLVGIERQVAVLAYQFGDGFTNIVVPTNAVLMGILAMARVPYDRWLRFVGPLMLKFAVAGSLALVVAVWIGYS